MHRGVVRRFRLFAAIALLVSAAALQGQQASPQTDSAADLTVGLQPGDTLDTMYADFPESAVLHLTVSGSGTIFVPYVGQVKIQGMTPEQAEQAIDDALVAKQIVKSPHVSINVTAARNFAVMVLGAVSLPHPVPLFAPAPLSLILSQVATKLNKAVDHNALSSICAHVQDFQERGLIREVDSMTYALR